MASKKITSNIEDYLEAIFRIERDRGVVRVKEISLAMGVTYPSTSGILKKMEQMELVEHERYGYVKLTENGRAVAEKILTREESLHRFLKNVLMLPDTIAQQDACLMEHAMSDETAERLIPFFDALSNPSEEMLGFLKPLQEQLSNSK